MKIIFQIGFDLTNGSFSPVGHLNQQIDANHFVQIVCEQDCDHIKSKLESCSQQESLCVTDIHIQGVFTHRDVVLTGTGPNVICMLPM